MKELFEALLAALRRGETAMLAAAAPVHRFWADGPALVITVK